MSESSGGFRGGSRGSLEPPSGPKVFHFHREFQEILCVIRKTNPPFLHLNPLFRNPGSATAETCSETTLLVFPRGGSFYDAFVLWFNINTFF